MPGGGVIEIQEVSVSASKRWKLEMPLKAFRVLGRLGTASLGLKSPLRCLQKALTVFTKNQKYIHSNRLLPHSLPHKWGPKLYGTILFWFQDWIPICSVTVVGSLHSLESVRRRGNQKTYRVGFFSLDAQPFVFVAVCVFICMITF